jgi:hypothetical protein
LKQLLSQSNNRFAMRNQSAIRRPVLDESPECADFNSLQSHFDTHSIRLPGWAGPKSIGAVADRIRRRTRVICRDFTRGAF